MASHTILRSTRNKKRAECSPEGFFTKYLAYNFEKNVVAYVELGSFYSYMRTINAADFL
jgi:hypothetical protein